MKVAESLIRLNERQAVKIKELEARLKTANTLAEEYMVEAVNYRALIQKLSYLHEPGGNPHDASGSEKDAGERWSYETKKEEPHGARSASELLNFVAWRDFRALQKKLR